MAKTIFTTQFDHINVCLENVKVKYKILPSGETLTKGKKKPKTDKIYVDIESVVCQGRDVSWLFSTKALEEYCVEDYKKQIAIGVEGVEE